MENRKILKRIIENLKVGDFAAAVRDCGLLTIYRDANSLSATIEAIKSQPTEEAEQAAKSAALMFANELIEQIDKEPIKNKYDELLDLCQGLVDKLDYIADNEGMPVCDCDDIFTPTPCSYCKAKSILKKEYRRRVVEGLRRPNSGLACPKKPAYFAIHHPPSPSTPPQNHR